MSSFIDQNFRSYANQREISDVTLEVIDPGETFKGNDLQKISNCAYVGIRNKTFVTTEDNEDNLDIVHGIQVAVSSTTIIPRGKNGVTVKGASCGIYLGLKFIGHGKECDIELGQFDNYWYPGRLPTRAVCINIDPNGDAPLIRLWDAREPSVVGPHRIERVSKAVWLPYFLFRYATLRVTNLWRRITRQPLIRTTLPPIE